MKNTTLRLLVCASLIGLSPVLVEAKNLESRLGVGFVNQFSNSTGARSVPAVSAKYGITKDMHVLAALGIDTQDPSVITAGGKFFKVLFFENNINFYAAGALAYVKLLDKSGIDVQALAGAEAFIPGIDSLGLCVEAGLGLSNVTGSFGLRTVGLSFLHAGIHFYF